MDEDEIPVGEEAMEDESGGSSDKAPAKLQDELTEEAATAIHTNIVTRLLPDLHKVVTKKSKSEEIHKLAGKSK